MIYRILLTGNDKETIDAFFDQLSDQYILATTSPRKVDIDNHISFFGPELMIVCLAGESDEELNVYTKIRRKIDKYNVSVAIIGYNKDCENFQLKTERLASLIMKQPSSVKVFDGRIQDHMVEVDKENARKNPGREQRREFHFGQSPRQGTVPPSQNAAPRNPYANPSMQAPPGQAAPVMRGGPAMTANPTIQPKPVMQPNPATQQSPAMQPGNGAQINPLTQPKASSQQNVPQNSPATKPEGTKKRILAVDDEPLMLKLIQEQLSDMYDVSVAITGKLAFKFLEKKTVDLVLLDYEMPGESGAEVIEKLRSNPAYKDIPIVFLTGVTNPDKIRKIMGFKPQGYVLKPVNREKMLEAIQRII